MIQFCGLDKAENKLQWLSSTGGLLIEHQYAVIIKSVSLLTLLPFSVTHTVVMSSLSSLRVPSFMLRILRLSQSSPLATQLRIK